jgi:hypothetical protein
MSVGSHINYATNHIFFRHDWSESVQLDCAFVCPDVHCPDQQGLTLKPTAAGGGLAADSTRCLV